MSELYQYYNFRDPLREKYPEVDYARIAGAYDELFVFANEVHEFEIEYKNGKFEDYKLSAIRKGSANLKALYVMSSICLRVVNHEVTGRGTGRNQDYSIGGMIGNRKVGDCSFFEGTRTAYCIEVYRNKILSHQEIFKMGGSLMDPNDGFFLHPVSMSIEENREKIDELLDSCFSSPSFAEIDRDSFSVHNDMNKLFEAYPIIGDDNKVSEGRRAVDSLVELVGCRSMHFTKVIEAINAYIFGIIEQEIV